WDWPPCASARDRGSPRFTNEWNSRAINNHWKMVRGPRMFIFEKAPFASCHASTIVEVEPGRFLAAWFGGTAEGKTDVKIWWARFDGTKWSPPEVAAEEPGFPCWNPVLFKSRSKTLFLFYKAGVNPMSWSGFVRRSIDDGKTWSKAEILPAGIL